MRVVILVLFVALAANAADVLEDYWDELNDVYELCITESKCDKEILRRHYNERNVDDPKLRKYLMCVSQKKGYRNEAGEYQQEVHRNSLIKIVKDEGKVNEILNKCVIKKDTPEESVLLSGRCFVEEITRFLRKGHTERKDKITKDCIAQTGASPDLVKALLKGEESDNEKIKDFSFCFVKSLGSINDAGDFNMAVIYPRLYLIHHNREESLSLAHECCRKKVSPKEDSYHCIVCKMQDLKRYLTPKKVSAKEL